MITIGRVLVVDDEQMNVHCLTEYLEQTGYEVLKAYNGAEALVIAAELMPDIVLLDFMMPGVNGLTVTETLKRNVETSNIPVVLVTALDSVEDKIKGLEAGADDFLSKPYNYAELTARIRSLIKLKKLQEKMVENVLNKEKEFTNNLIQNATVPIFVLDRNHRVLIWNNACERLTGFRTEDMIGTNKQWQPFHSYPRPTLADIVIDGMQERVAEFFPVHSPSPDNSLGLRSEGWFANLCGEKRYISFHAAPIYNSEGDLISVIETLEDITNRKKAESEILREKNFSDGLINSLPGIFFLINEDLHFERWNKNFEEITGYSSKDLTGMSPAELFASDDQNLFKRNFQASNAQSKRTAEFLLLTRDGNKIPYFLMISSILINAERHVIVTGIDLVDRYEIEEVLRKLSRAVEQSSSSIVITDTAGAIEYVNPSFLELFGCSLGEVIGLNAFKAEASLPLLDIFGESLGTVMAGGEWRGEQQNRRNSGEPYWEFITVSPIKNADDITTHYLAVKEDITARKNAERELRKSKAELIVQHEQQKILLNQVKSAKEEWENSMDCIGDIVILSNSEDRIKRCNKALCELMGKSYQEISGKEWQKLFSENCLAIPSPCESGKELFP